jgi:hypothetical protein
VVLFNFSKVRVILRGMTYEVTFATADRWQRLPYVKLLNCINNDGTSLKMEVIVDEEDMSSFEQEIDSHPHVRSWRRFGGDGWCEITSRLRKARQA